MTYQQTCKQHIIDTIEDWKGQEVDICDLGHMLTEGENANGSWYCSTYKAQEDLKAWFDDVAQFIEDYEDEYGVKPQHDTFTQPELFHCLMMIVGVEKAFNELDCIQDLWNESVVLDDKLINQIKEELE